MGGNSDSAVVGLDVGSSAVKACLFDLSSDTPRLLREQEVSCALSRPRPGWAEHDLQGLVAAVRQVLEVAPAGASVGWTSAMHGLVLLDERGRPLGNAISWADGRSGEQARALQKEDPGAYPRTGTPLHPMAWPAKLRWVREERAELWQATRRITDLKSYLWEAVLGEVAPLDRSSASATGLWNSQEEVWDEALRGHLQHIALPPVRDAHRLEGRCQHHLGAADGPLGNLGLGAVGEGRVALSLGTSGAVRRFRAERGAVSPGLFLYALGALGWVEGGAISNGGSVLGWLRRQRDLPPESLLELACQAPEGARDLCVYPYFSGERAPFWRTDVRSGISGWTYQHSFADLARATLEGVAFCLRRLLDMVGESAEPISCSGGLFASEGWRQLFANACGRRLVLGGVEQASALGAALLTLADAGERALRLPAGELVEPAAAAARHYDEIFAAWLARDPEKI